MDDDIRRSQVIGPFGVGAMRVKVGGTSMICASLDHWYQKHSQLGNTNSRLDTEKIRIMEYRLKKNLNVDYFLPPPRWDKNENSSLAFIPLPFFRFPQFEYCSNKYCGKTNNDKKLPGQAIFKKQLTDTENISYCNICKNHGRKYQRTPQMNMVVVCKNGHIDDFPWFEWAHSLKSNHNCNESEIINSGQLKFKQTSDVGVAGQKVICMGCESERNLANSFELNQQIRNYKCTGNRPWFGGGYSEACNEVPKARFRTASSVYYPLTRSALYIPIDAEGEVSNIFDELDNNDSLKNEILKFENLFKYDVKEYGFNKTKELLKYDKKDRDQITRNFSFLIDEIGKVLEDEDYEQKDIIEAVRIKVAGEEEQDNEEIAPTEATFQGLKYQEYISLNQDRDSKLLVTKKSDLQKYSNDIKQIVNDIVLVEKITETRAFYGFARDGNEKNIEESIENIRYKKPKTNENWLPATRHHGEGIFLNFNLKEINKRLDNETIDKKIESIQIQQENGLDIIDKFREFVVTKSFLFIHTLSHLLINELIYDSGYSAASLSERVFVNYEDSEKEEMSGLLIYTSAGDSEGTMGGLVRLGKPEFFNKIFNNALRKALWCSTDPVCNETPRQGPYGLNQGACYSCSLLPETSCELNNSFLDRGIVVGTQSNPDMGVFQL